MAKYIVYENDLKFKTLSNINSNNAIWYDDDVKDKYNNKEIGTLENRLKKCYESEFDSLDLSYLNLETIPNLKMWQYYNELKKIKCLFLNNNKLTICDDSLNCYENLEVLDVSCNDIENITFLPEKIKEFVCHNNKITFLPPHQNLLKLDCSFNNIEKLPILSKLSDLICDNNNLTTIQTYPNINRIICDKNPISIISSQPTLLYLDCSTTNISSKLCEMNNLIYLVCNNTKINDISNLTKLKNLEMIQTSITHIPYLKSLMDLLCSNSDNIKICDKYKVDLYRQEKEYLYIKFIQQN